ncbi:MAG: aromatic ring-hydroxylating oxygenase subunit alpha [Myxococcota bacterium]
MSSLRRELARFDPALEIGRATTPPSSWYTDPGFFALERSRLLDTWQPIARTDALTRPGDFVAGCTLGEPCVAVRGEDGALRVLRNACLHHGAEVARGSGRARRLVCPYHGWSYELDGRLATRPRAEGLVGLEPGTAGLPEVPARECGPFVFAALGGAAPAAPPIPADLEARLRETRWHALRHVGRRSYALDCNWKVFVDNYLDGGYHVAPLHRGLGARLAGETYRTEVRDRWVLQTVQAAAAHEGEASDAGVDFAARVGSGALYAFVHPHFMLNRYGPFLDTNHVIPLAVDRTLVVFDDFVDGAAPEIAGPEGAEFVRRSLAASEAVQREDEAICESVQRSLASRAFDRGRYAPAVENGLYAFHLWWAADLAAGASAGGPTS